MPIPRICELHRRRRCLTSSVCAVLFLGFCLAAPIYAGDTELAERLYETAVEHVGRVSAKESIKAFRRVLRADTDFAPAHYEIAKLYMSLDTPMDRQSARNALDEAIRLDPGNGDYQLKFGELLGKQGLWLNAERHYEKIYETHPEKRAQAAYMAGFFAMQAFFKYIDMEHIDIVPGAMGGPPTYHLFRWEKFGSSDREKALTFLTRSIDADPGYREAYYDLGLIHYESRNPEGLVTASRLCLDQFPEDKDALVYCGLGYQGMGEWETAHVYYRRALERMSGHERALMESVDVIASREEKSALDSISMTDTVRDELADSLERVRFWRKRDPLYLTAFSERRMEHYGRVAYANLRYGQRLKGILGWQTDRGKAYIKFGRYLKKKVERPEIGGGVDSFEGEFRRDFHGGDEMWIYEGFTISFVNSDGLDSWRFDTRPGRISARYRFDHQPAHFIDPYGHHKYRIPYLAAIFKDGDGQRMELAYALPKFNVSASDSNRTIAIENGVFVFDEDWDEVYRKHSDLKLRWPELTSSGYPVADSLRNSHLVFQLAFKVPNSRYNLVGEIRDRKRGSIGTFRERRRSETLDSLFSMSDLLLATQIESRTPFPEGRSDLTIVANPHRTYHRSESAFIYLEVYNLERDEFGRSEYEISYRLGRPEQKKIDPYLFLAQRLPEGGRQLEVTREIRTQETGIRRPVRASGREEELQGGLPVTPPVVVPDYFDAQKRDEVTYRARFLFPDEDELPSRIKKMGKSRAGVETTITARYEGDREDDFTYLQIDLSHVPAGVHRLSVTVKDMHTGQIAARETLFRVIE
ncbi:MAG: GWxTD domain-containing protein [Gemmatimonadota bacterium]|nr:GWxTD domain-containing protein [Gemmatimonadota bacterium]